MRAVLPALEYAASAMDALTGADACVLVTEWDEFLSLDWAQVKDSMARPIVIDGRNALDGQKLGATRLHLRGRRQEAGPWQRPSVAAGAPLQTLTS